MDAVKRTLSAREKELEEQSGKLADVKKEFAVMYVKREKVNMAEL